MTSIGPFPMNGDPSRTDYDHVIFYPSSSQSGHHPATGQDQFPPQSQPAGHCMVQQAMAGNIPTFVGEHPPIYHNDSIDDDPSDEEPDIPPHGQGTYLQIPPAHPHMVAHPDGKDENMSLATNTAVAYPDANSYVYTGYTPRSRSGTASSGMPQRYAWVSWGAV